MYGSRPRERSTHRVASAIIVYTMKTDVTIIIMSASAERSMKGNDAYRQLEGKWVIVFHLPCA